MTDQASKGGAAPGGGQGGGPQQPRPQPQAQPAAPSQGAATPPAPKPAGGGQPARRPGGPQAPAQGRQQQQAMRLQPRGRPTPGRARFRLRHLLILLSFLLFFVGPVGGAAWYLYTQAAPQYHSQVSFSVHSEDAPSASSILTVFSQSTPSSASDTDILYDFISSQQIVEDLSKEIDLRAIFNRPENDPVFTLGEGATVEELHSYWQWMVYISFDRSTGIIDTEVRAFTPEDAQAVGAAIVKRSSELINTLSLESRTDLIEFARRDLEEAKERVNEVRKRLQVFRNKYQMINPETDIEKLMLVLNTLEQQLQERLIERDLLIDRVSENDSRLVTINREIAAIEARIMLEQTKLGIGEGADAAAQDQRLAEVVGEFEDIIAERSFAERAYTAVLAQYEQARADARRKHRYLLSHIGPTKAEKALYPQKEAIMAMLVIGLFCFWLVFVMIFFNVKDRR